MFLGEADAVVFDLEAHNIRQSVVVRLQLLGPENAYSHRAALAASAFNRLDTVDYGFDYGCVDRGRRANVFDSSPYVDIAHCNSVFFISWAGAACVRSGLMIAIGCGRAHGATRRAPRPSSIS